MNGALFLLLALIAVGAGILVLAQLVDHAVHTACTIILAASMFGLGRLW